MSTANQEAENAEVISETPNPAPREGQARNYNPLTEEPVNEKSYAKPNIKINPKEASIPIPEPTIVPPPSGQGEQAKKAPDGTPPPPVNPKMSELNAKEKANAAKTAAAMAMNAYEAVNMFGNHMIKVNDGKVRKLQKKGLIDLRIPIPVGEGEYVTISEYIEEYNKETGDVFTVTKEFKDEVTPVLERVLEKKGIGATDEQQLLYFFAKDLVVKGAQFIALTRQRNEFINKLAEATEAYRQGIKIRQQAAQPQPQPAPQATPQPQSQQDPKTAQTFEQSRPPYTPPPVPPSFEEDDVEVAEIIPNEVFDQDSEIPEPEDAPVLEISDFKDNGKQKRTKATPKPAPAPKASTKGTRRRNRLED